jgi:hypothetical protein
MDMGVDELVGIDSDHGTLNERIAISLVGVGVAGKAHCSG